MNGPRTLIRRNRAEAPERSARGEAAPVAVQVVSLRPLETEGWSRGNRAVKRATDLVGAVFGLLACAPLIAVFGALVSIVDPGPPLFAHEREGLGGRRFRMWKIRSMRRGERILEDHLENDPEARQEWNRRFKLRDDPRLVAGVGRWIRRFSLDEMPQFWNVLVGDMSLVGPRPLPDYHLSYLCERFRIERERVRPGLTGLWQVNIRSFSDVRQLEHFDRRYLEERTLGLDLRILAATVLAVVGGKGAV